jgi:hypothetical protein
MAIILKEKVGQQVSAGTHIAVCHRIALIGTQPDTGFGEREKLVIFWEIPGETIEFDGKTMPMGLSKIYSLGTSGGMNKKSALRQDLAAWRGRDFTKDELEGFTLNAILGKACQVTVEHNEEGRAKVSRVVGLPKGMPAPTPVNPLVEYSIADGKTEVYKALPEWVRKMCDACLEWNPEKRTSTPSVDPHESFPPADASDDVPF